MKIKIWGARGSIPAPIAPEVIEEKIVQAILNLPEIDLHDPAAVRAYVHQLSPLARGTVGGNTTCVEIQAGEETYIIDAGSGIRALGETLMRGPCGRGQGKLHLFFTHPHWDHIQGFPFFRPAFVQGNRIHIYSVHDLSQALQDQQRPLNFPVSLNYMKASFSFTRLTPGETLSLPPMTINSIELAHPGKAYAYRFEDEHSVFVFASDAEYKDLKEAQLRPYVDFYRDADVLIFDAQYDQREAWEKVDWGHSSSLIGVDLARRARVKKLVLFHHDPSSSDDDLLHIQENTVAYKTAQSINCEVVVAYEGLTFNLTPPGAVSVSYTSDEGCVILTPNQVFDESGIENLEAQLLQLQESGWPDSIIINLAQVETLTMAGLKALISLRTEHPDTSIALAGPSERVLKVVDLAGYRDFFAIYSSVELARAALRQHRVSRLPGQTLKKRYYIDSKLGDGRLGTVFKGTDTLLNLPIAVKTLSPSFGEGVISQFLRQAHQIVAMDHPNIVKVYSRDEDQNYAFIVEEFIPGHDLQMVLDTQGRVSSAQAMDIGLVTAEALAYAHRHNVLHGDLKPKNILLANTIKLTDFGLGRLQEGRSLTDAPLLFLSAPYLSPEQIRGEVIDQRTDLYALGVLLYRLFTDRLPFEGSEADVLDSHLHAPVPPPIEHNPELSRLLNHFILKLMAKSRAERYHSARQAWRILRNLLPNNEQDVSLTTHLRQQHHALVGREAELAHLSEAWSSLRTGRGQIGLIEGPVGIGKTHLAHAFAAQTQSPDVLIGHGFAEQPPRPFGPLVDALNTYLFSLPPKSLPPSLHQTLEPLLDILPVLRQHVPNGTPAAVLPPDGCRHRLMHSLLVLIQHICRKRSWMLILDNLQWADAGTLDFLALLTKQVGQLPLLVLGLYRNDEAPAVSHLDPVKTLQNLKVNFKLSLAPLTVTHTEAMLTALWGTPMSEESLAALHQHCGGVPLHLLEVVQVFENDELVIFEDGQWRFDVENWPWSTNTLNDIILRHLNQLNAQTRTLLKQTAVLGADVNLDILQTMSALSEADFLARLDVVLDQQFLHEAPHPDTLRFIQPQVQAVIYDNIQAAQKRRQHQQAAEALQATPEHDQPELRWALAYHYRQAGMIRGAIPHLLDAAAQARAAGDVLATQQWYQQILGLLTQPDLREDETLHQVKIDAHRALAQLYMHQANDTAASEHYHAAQAEIEATPSMANQARQLANLHRERATLAAQQKQYDQAREHLIQGAAHLQNSAHPLEIIVFQLDQVELALAQDDFSTAQTLAETVMRDLHRLVRPDETSPQQHLLHAQAQAFLGRISHQQGQWRQAIQYFEKSLFLYHKTEDILSQIDIQTWLGDLYLARGEWEQTRAQYLTALEQWRRIGSQRGQLGLELRLAQLYIQTEDWVEARACLQASEGRLQNFDLHSKRPQLLRMWGLLFYHLNEVETALDVAHQAAEQSLRQQDFLEEALAFRLLGRIHALRQKPDLAEAALYKSLQRLETLANTYEHARTLLALARLNWQCADKDIAATNLHQAQQVFQRFEARADLAETQALQDVWSDLN